MGLVTPTSAADGAIRVDARRARDDGSGLET